MSASVPQKAKEPRAGWIVRTAISLGIALAATFLVLVAFLLEDTTKVRLISPLENRLVDLRFLLRGPRPTQGDIAIVAIDAPSTEEIGRWPWSRTKLAELVDRLREADASAVVFDVLLTEPQGAAEAARLQAIADALPPRAEGAPPDPARQAIDKAMADVLADKVLATSLVAALDADKALPVWAFDFVFAEDARRSGHVGRTLTGSDEQAILDLASFASREENMDALRTYPPKVAIGVRPMVNDLAMNSAGLGFVNPILDSDGSLRREQMLVVFSPALREAFTQKKDLGAAIRDKDSGVQAYMGLPMAGLVTHRRLRVDQILLDLPNEEIRLPSKDGKGTISYRFDPDDGTMPIDYYGGVATFPTWSFADVLRKQPKDSKGNLVDMKKAFAGKMVFVGATDQGLGDFFSTPFTSRLPGVEKHANVAENLIEGRSIHEPPDSGKVIILCALAAALIVAVCAGNFSALLGALVIFLTWVAFLVITYQQFVSNGLIVNWAVPALATFLSFTGVIVYRQLAEARAKKIADERGKFIQATFGRYLSKEVVSRLVDSEGGLTLGGEKKRITILMSDLRGFTSLCERSSPEEVISMLNKYLGTMADTVIKHGGMVDEFIGDAVLALFGAPEKHEDDAQRAIACAIEMQLGMPGVNEYCRAHNLPEVEMGIALNTGDVIVGNIGSEKRSKYGVVGSAINLTARIESYTVGGQILVSGETLKEAGDIVVVGDMVEVKAKGVAEPIPAYDLRAIAGRFNVTMPEMKEVFITPPQPVLVKFATLDGKHVGEETFTATFTLLSKIGADMLTNQSLSVRTNIKLQVIGYDGQPIEGDLYAKVVDRESTPGTTALRFTSTPPTIKKFFKPMLEAATQH